MNKILALLDGSIYSESVCHHTAWVAARLPASVEAMHVLGRREGVDKQDLSGTLRLGARSRLLAELAALDEQRAKLAAAQGHAILEDAETILRADGVTQVSRRLRRGDLLDALHEVEADTRAIVLGKRGEGADFASGHLGSNLERIVRSTQVPVLVAARAFRPVARVLLAYDDSPSARRAVDRMANSPVFAGLSVTVAHVGGTNPAVTEPALTRLRAAGLSVTPRTLPGEPDAVLGRLIAEDGFDLLVMGAYGHSRIRTLIIGSTTTAMIQTVRAPVLLYR